MIFLTIGSHEPFDRLVEAVDNWASTAEPGKVFGQITDNGHYVPKHFESVAYLDAAAYRSRIGAADLLVAHAGMGSIITAMDHGKPIVVMPRRGHLKETRNDHQYATAKKFRGKAGIYVAEDETALAAAINRAQAELGSARTEPGSPYASAKLVSFLKGVFAG